MASLFGQARNLFGKAVSGTGAALGLPEFGLSERVSGQPQPQITPQAASTQQPQQSTQLLQSKQAFGGGQVLGAATGPSFGGGAPAGGAVPQGIPLEQAPQAPSLDFDALIQPGLEALGQAEQAAQGLFSASEAGIETSRQQAVGRAELAGEEGAAAVTSAERKAEAAGKGAVGEQRRGFGEVARGLAARFGSAISTGLGAEAIAGRQALQNISSIRAGLAETIQDLGTRRESIRSVTQNAIKEAEANAVNQKTNAKAGLQSALADIGSRRGELQSRRAELVFGAIESFRQTVSDVNARNTQFQQQLFQQQEAADQKIQAAVARAQQTADNLPSFELSPGQTKFIPTSSLGEDFGLPEGTDITSGQAGPFTTFSSPGGSDESTDERINRLFGTQ